MSVERDTITITADGQPMGTRITAADGTDLSGIIQSIEWKHEGGGLPKAICHLALFPVTLADQPVRFVMPDGRKLLKAVFENAVVRSTFDVSDGGLVALRPGEPCILLNIADPVSLSPDEARTLARRLNEAADLSE